MRGSESLAIINQYFATAGEEVKAVHRQLEELNQRRADVNRQASEAYSELAQFRLDELSASRVSTHLDDTDRALLAILDRRRKALSSLEKDTVLLEEELIAMTNERTRAVEVRDELIKQVDELVSEVKAELELQDTYRDQEKIVSEAAARAEQAENKANQAEADRDEKGRPYRDDPKFMYLWKRRYLTPDYSGSGIIRMMDGWVAKLINYPDVRSNYFLLTELPLRLRQHADLQARIAGVELDKIHALEAKAMKDENLVEKKSELQAAQNSVEKMEAEIETKEKQLESFLRQRSDFSHFRDEHSQKALQLQVSELKNDSLADLYAMALKTAKPDDDVSVGRILDLQREDQQLADEIKLSENHVYAVGKTLGYCQKDVRVSPGRS